jgi:hypothetical protein
MASSDFWSISTLLGFLLTLMRIGGVFVFVPLPGLRWLRYGHTHPLTLPRDCSSSG